LLWGSGMLKRVADVLLWVSIPLAFIWMVGAGLNALFSASILGKAAITTFATYGILPAIAFALTGRLISYVLLLAHQRIR